MSATRRKHSASATLEPPNLCTTQEDELAIEVEFHGRKGRATLLTAPPARNSTEALAKPQCRDCDGDHEERDQLRSRPREWCPAEDHAAHDAVECVRGSSYASHCAGS